MKKFILPAMIAVSLVAVTALNAQDYKTALGVRLSSASAAVNNSISIKHFINDRAAIEGLFSFGDPLAFGAMLEIHKPLAASGLSWFYGGGGYLSFLKTYNVNQQKNEIDPNFGAMGVLGLDYKFANVPLNLSLDWKPELNLVSDINFEPAAVGFTARFTLGRKAAVTETSDTY
jgi:hypothetical protein